MPLTLFNCNTLAAAGTTNATAAAIGDDTVNVTITAGNTGVILPAGCYRIFVQADPTNAGSVNVYPPSGAKLGTIATDNPLILSPGERYLLCEATATQWGYVVLS